MDNPPVPAPGVPAAAPGPDLTKYTCFTNEASKAKAQSRDALIIVREFSDCNHHEFYCYYGKYDSELKLWHWKGTCLNFRLKIAKKGSHNVINNRLFHAKRGEKSKKEYEDIITVAIASTALPDLTTLGSTGES